MAGPNDKGHRANGAPEFETQIIHPHFADVDDASKALAMMKARAALCGCALHEMADGSFLLANWNYCCAVPCLRAVGDLLRQIGGRR